MRFYSHSELNLAQKNHQDKRYYNCVAVVAPFSVKMKFVACKHVLQLNITTVNIDLF